MTEQATAPRPITELSLAELRARIVEAAAYATRAANYGKEAAAEIDRRLQQDAKNLMAAKGKTSGEATLEVDGEKYKVEISKSVSWNNDALQQVASTLDWATTQKLFKIDLSVSETIFKAAESTNPELFAQLQAARTVKYGDAPTVKPIFEKK